MWREHEQGETDIRHKRGMQGMQNVAMFFVLSFKDFKISLNDTQEDV